MCVSKALMPLEYVCAYMCVCVRIYMWVLYVCLCVCSFERSTRILLVITAEQLGVFEKRGWTSTAVYMCHTFPFLVLSVCSVLPSTSVEGRWKEKNIERKGVAVMWEGLSKIPPPSISLSLFLPTLDSLFFSLPDFRNSVRCRFCQGSLVEGTFVSCPQSLPSSQASQPLRPLHTSFHQPLFTTVLPTYVSFYSSFFYI